MLSPLRQPCHQTSSISLNKYASLLLSVDRTLFLFSKGSVIPVAVFSLIDSTFATYGQTHAHFLVIAPGLQMESKFENTKK